VARNPWEEAMSKFRVLVVDDYPDMQWLLTATLERSGINTSIACDGMEALEVLAAGDPPDAIVTDIDMPGMNGIQLIERLGLDDRLRGVPIIVASVYPTSRVTNGLRDSDEAVRLDCIRRDGR